MINALFYLAISCILVHEMDAVRAKEWCLLPLLNRLNDHHGLVWFNLLHVPLYLAILLAITPSGPSQGFAIADGLLRLS